MRLSDENLRGRTVISDDAQVVGEVNALYLDSEAWRIEALQIKLLKEVADELGADRGLFHAGQIELPVRLIQSVGDTVLLSVSVNGLRQTIAAETPADEVKAAQKRQRSAK